MATRILNGVTIDDAGVIQCSTAGAVATNSAFRPGFQLDASGNLCIVAEASQARRYIGGLAFDTSNGKLIYAASGTIASYVAGIPITVNGAVVTVAAAAAVGYVAGIALTASGTQANGAP